MVEGMGEKILYLQQTMFALLTVQSYIHPNVVFCTRPNQAVCFQLRSFIFLFTYVPSIPLLPFVLCSFSHHHGKTPLTAPETLN